MTAESEPIVLRLFEVINSRDLDALQEVLAEDCPVYGNGTLQFKGLDEYRDDVGKFHAAFPDLHVTVEDLIASRARTATRATVRGTHRGEFEGVPATGKSVEFSSIVMHRLAAGRIVEEHYNADFFSLMQQIGATPS